jgi:hypothetical protein
MLARGGRLKNFPRHIQKKAEKISSGQTQVKLRFKNFFRTNTCKITGKTHFFGPIPVKLRSKNFSHTGITYIKNVNK